MSALDELHKQLMRVMQPKALAVRKDSVAGRRLVFLRQHIAPPHGRFAQPNLAKGVMRFRVLKQHTPYPDLKYACYGLARPVDWEGRLLIEDMAARDLLAALTALSHGGERRGCLQALRQALAQDLDTSAKQIRLSQKGQANLSELLGWLAKQPI